MAYERKFQYNVRYASISALFFTKFPKRFTDKITILSEEHFEFEIYDVMVLCIFDDKM